MNPCQQSMDTERWECTLWIAFSYRREYIRAGVASACILSYLHGCSAWDVVEARGARILLCTRWFYLFVYNLRLLDRWHWNFKGWMGILTGRSRRTKPTEIPTAGHPFDMLISTGWPVFTETAGIPHTLSDLGWRVNVQIKTLCIRALPVFGKKPALWHFLQVVFMKKFA